MMYNNRLVVVIRNNGKVLREQGETVRIPFGTEYSLGFKNLENRKAVVFVEIDGTKVLGNHSLILNPGQEVNLERFVTDGNLNKGNRFKFIKKTKEISDYRGDKIDDGLIRIGFRFEIEETYYIKSLVPQAGDSFESGNFDGGRNVYRCASASAVNYSSCEKLCAPISNKMGFLDDEDDDGITVKGSVSNQGFQFGFTRPLESKSYTMVFRLSGYDSNKVKIEKPITIRTKLQCETCGKKSRSSNKFCPKCGTSLI